MRKLLKDKRGIEELQGVIIFAVLNMIFFVAMFVFVGRAGTGDTLLEQKYSKQII